MKVFIYGKIVKELWLRCLTGGGIRRTPCQEQDSMVICNDCIGSCKSNYHTITTTTTPSAMTVFTYEKKMKQINGSIS